MLTLTSDKFLDIYKYFMTRFLVDGESVQPGHWQGVDVQGKPENDTRELRNVVIDYQIRFDPTEDIIPNKPWVDVHFSERVSGKPHNPPPSHSLWPHAQKSNEKFVLRTGRFSHTYPERIWPRTAGDVNAGWNTRDGMWGIRFRYGDLEDVLNLLTEYPNTRQAFLPIWFPEDTGAHHGERVPCSLGYHFMVRGAELECTYFIRSCDFRRHFADDLYLAVRLAQWVADRISEKPEESQGLVVRASRVIMHIVSFHVFEADIGVMQQELEQEKRKAGYKFTNSIMEALG